MTPQGFALWATVHGLLAVLALALLLHPVITLRTRRALAPWTRRTAWLAALLLAVPFGIGWWLYPHYRRHIKPTLWERADPALLRFETKEHLAAMALALAVSGAVTLQVSGTSGRRAAWALLLAAWVCGVAAAGLGVQVAAVARPGW